ncbi:MAG: EAL domain-containing protein, partial [Actinomycetia bacterium]|nr:EAL domain-containing protein [Actinomycetes bacterium]
ALVVGLVASELFFAFLRFSSWLSRRPSILDSNLRLHSAFRSILPVLLTLLVAVLLRLSWDGLNSWIDIGGPLHNAIQNNLVNDSLPAVLQLVLYSQLLGFVGIHNSTLLVGFFPFVGDLAQPGSVLFAIQDFYLQFVQIGGQGATLGLLVALFAVGRYKKGRSMARAALFPALFNINEPLLYGFPIILNPFMLLPFLLAPLVSALTSYAAFTLGWVPPITQAINWASPPLLSGYLSTGSVNGSLLQLVNILISVLLYIPFVRAQRNFERQQFATDFAALSTAAVAAADDEGLSVINRDDSVGEMARLIVTQLKQFAAAGKLPFQLVYQPKTDASGGLVGSEALLRWHSPEYGDISPIMLVELMEESGLTTVLGRWVAQRAIQDYTRLKQRGLAGVKMSLNLSAHHLAEDDDLLSYLQKLRDKYKLAPSEVELEITEHAVVKNTQKMQAFFGEARQMGYELAIDDMGIGYSSLRYISDFGASAVKVDISMIDRIQADRQQQEIIRSITELARSLQLEVVVEGVETAAQVEALSALGVRVFQGYYFSKPLSVQEFLSYGLAHPRGGGN